MNNTNKWAYVAPKAELLNLENLMTLRLLESFSANAEFNDWQEDGNEENWGTATKATN